MTDICYYHRFREKDAILINSIWKYQSSHSVDMVKSMIASQRCLGIQYTTNNGTDTTNGSELVCWCLTYIDYDAIGMLYTLPVCYLYYTVLSYCILY